MLENKNHEVMTFQFSESQNQVRTVLENHSIYFVGADVAKVLGYKNSRKALKDHCKGVTKSYILTNGGRQKMNIIPEGDVFRLIIHSELPSAQKFERWVMEEVLPSIRKKGYYNVQRSSASNDFIDARNIPYTYGVVNGKDVRVIDIDGTLWVNINDVNASLDSRTGSYQTARSLNAVQTLAKKILLFGNTHPAWFTNELGVKLMLSGSRKVRFNQLKLSL